MMILLFLLFKTQNYLFLSSLYQQKTITNYQNILANGLKDQCIGMNTKQKVRIKIRQRSVDILSNQALWKLTDCLFWSIQIKMTMLKDSRRNYLPKGILKNYNIIINGKKFITNPSILLENDTEK